MAESMYKVKITFVACFLVACGACSKREEAAVPEKTGAPSPAPAASPTDACSLLTSEEIQAIQGEPLQDAKLSRPGDGALAISQCFFGLPSFAKSISLQVVGKGSGSRGAREDWREIFSPGNGVEGETEAGEAKKAPQRIPDLGEEAYWSTGPFTVLHVLEGERYLRISVGGADDEKTKLEKSKSIARLVLPRL